MAPSFDGLLAVTMQVFQRNPVDGHLFLFLNRRRDRIKLMWWDHDGLAVFYKRSCAIDASCYNVNMHDAREFPQDVETCHELLRQLTEAYSRLRRIYDELLGTCSSIQEAQQKLEQERDELQLTIKELMARLYGRRSERTKFSPDQLPLDFGDGEEPVPVEPEPSQEPPIDEAAEEAAGAAW